MASRRSVLITGCSDGGIGAALSRAFSSHGFHVYATARNVSKMKSLEGNDNITLLPLDIVDSMQVNRIVETISKETNGTLDYLVNNATRARFMPLLDEDIEAAKSLYDVNVWAPLQLVQVFSPLLIKSKGTIVFIVSVSGYLNVPWQGTYAASKRSLEILGDNLRVELAPFNVEVVSIVTGATKSNIHSRHEEWKMPETSHYLVVEEHFLKRAKGDDGAPRMDTQRYAEGVVLKLLNKPGPKFWYGGAVGLIKFAVSWFPTSWLDSFLTKGTGIDTMVRAKQ